ncbi:serine/threonine-protein kinase [Yinghuangia soli]|uniref:non-specific serine/threonine protein kinase n=1 Tax=Yinghuangia soli TaxID=2908204 RepID=A0AA41U2D8_9ACTN|nr:serine/threonine-protein kinase [Yinghuangia soli]MCF2527009.1 serine/threonine protein kinase [Yinghuangia soli]
MVQDDVLGGRYRLVRLLGEGGMGQVWKARDESLDRAVAVKVIALLAGRGSHGSEARARFQREARLTARLQHPGIVTIHDIGETGTGDDRTPFLVMELVRGTGLDALLLGGPVGVRDAAEWGAQISAALSEAHTAGILHRDIKPSNVLVTPSGHVKVLDFGIARAADPYATAGRLTQTGFIVGTPPYMAPEQARGFPEPRSDLYALGCLLFELTTGRLPFEAPDTVGYLTAHLTEPPPAPGTVAQGIPAAWDALVLGLLAKDPEQRPASADDVTRMLRDFARTLDATASAPTEPRNPAPPGGAAAQGPTRADRGPGTARPRTAAEPRRAAPAPRQPLRSTPPQLPETLPPRPPRAVVAAVLLAALCLPGQVTMVAKCLDFITRTGAPVAMLVVNIAVAAGAGYALATGAWRLWRGDPAGRRRITAGGTGAALLGTSVFAQVPLTGGELSMDIAEAEFIFIVCPLTAVAAIAAIIATRQASTARWCALVADEASVPG